MITDTLQQLAGLFSRRFSFNALLPTFVFTTTIVSTVAASWWSIEAAYAWWGQLDLLTHLLLLLTYSALVYFLAAAISSQWRNIVRLFEGYPLKKVANRLNIDPLGQRWHQEHMDQLASDEEGNTQQAYYRYPLKKHRGEVMPTRLGNILLAGEYYAYDRYNIDTIYFWPRLYPLLPEAFQRDHEASIIQYQFPLVVAFQATVTTVICAMVLLITHSPAIAFAATLLGGTVVAYGAYILSLPSAIEMAEQQRTAFDLYRDRLLTAWPSVADVKDEKAAFLEIKAFVVHNAPPTWDPQHRNYIKRHRAAQGPT
jgi:hypothetical protein